MTRRISVIAAVLFLSACADRLTGPAAQNAAREYQSKTVAEEKVPLIFLDGKEITTAQARTFSSDSILSVEVIKGKAALEKYGDRAKNGVILVESKRAR